MPTTTVKSVGSGGGRDYSTLAGFEAACPSNLVSADEIWKGECYNDSEFLNDEFAPSGVTTDATRYIWLTTASGQGFKDNGGAATLPLKYDQSKGVGVRATGNYRRMVTCGSIKSVLQGLQFYYDTTYGSASFIPMTGNGVELYNCIVQTRQQGAIFMHDLGACINSVVISLSVSGTTTMWQGNKQVRDSTFVRPTGLAGGTVTAITNNFGYYPTVKNCAVFGHSTNFGGTIGSYNVASSNNATDSASAPGSSNQTSLTFGNQFEDVANASQDWRAKSGGALINNAVRDQTYTNDLDIIAAARSTSTPTIGAREFAGGGGGGGKPYLYYAMQRGQAH